MYLRPALLLAPTLLATSVFGQACADGGKTTEIEGNWYCPNPVTALSFTNFGTPGNFSMVTKMVNNVGICSMETQKDFGGGLAPYNEQISWHFRGPMHLKQFAVYALGSNKSKKRSIKPSIQERRHGHRQQHKRSGESRNAERGLDNEPKALDKRETCAMITATIDGKVVSWMNNYMCAPAPATSVAATPSPLDNAKAGNTVASGSASTITVTVVGVSRVTLTTTVTPTVTKTLSKSDGSIANFVASETDSSTPQSYTSATSVSQIAPSSSILADSGGDSSGSSNSPSPTSSTTSDSAVDSASNMVSTASASLSSSSGSLSSANPPSASDNDAPSSKSVGLSTGASATAPQPSASGGPIADGDYGRTAYYNSKDQTADALVFLNANTEHSGVFDNKFGSSMAYAGSDGVSGSASPEILQDILLPDDKEVVIFSDQACDDSCPYYRPGSVAHKGFDTAHRVFLFEFDMPSSGDKDTYSNGDMPAIWSLNTRIPLTQQYGDCSCWNSGCGELDIWEVLDPGNTRMKATFHGGAMNSGGSSNYFDRPIDKTMKGAVIFDEPSQSVHILKLDDSFEFGSSITGSDVQSWLDNAQKDAKQYGNFRLAS